MKNLLGLFVAMNMAILQTLPCTPSLFKNSKIRKDDSRQESGKTV